MWKNTDFSTNISNILQRKAIRTDKITCSRNSRNRFGFQLSHIENSNRLLLEKLFHSLLQVVNTLACKDHFPEELIIIIKINKMKHVKLQQY